MYIPKKKQSGISKLFPKGIQSYTEGYMASTKIVQLYHSHEHNILTS
jgi:hypothetical protein